MCSSCTEQESAKCGQPCLLECSLLYLVPVVQTWDAQGFSRSVLKVEATHLRVRTLVEVSDDCKRSTLVAAKGITVEPCLVRPRRAATAASAGRTRYDRPQTTNGSPVEHQSGSTLLLLFHLEPCLIRMVSLEDACSLDPQCAKKHMLLVDLAHALKPFLCALLACAYCVPAERLVLMLLLASCSDERHGRGRDAKPLRQISHSSSCVEAVAGQDVAVT